MKKRVLALAFVLSLGFIFSSLAVDVIEDPQGITIKTHLYELYWSADTGSHGMGYIEVTFEGLEKKLMSGGELFHDLDYMGGKRHWGAMIEKETEILQEAPDVAVVKYISHDDRTLEYTCIATYWEDAPYFKHEVTVTNDGAEAQAWPMTGEDPSLIPGIDIEWDDAKKEGNMALSKEPLPHIVYWNDEGFGGLYGSTAKARPRFGDWAGLGVRIRLDHGLAAKNIKKKETSPVLVYYLGFGAGGEDEAHALAAQIMETPEGKAVKPAGKVSATWGAIKASH
jgi:hypothetical protein